MKIAIALFVYDRSYHTNKVLEALKENTVLPEKLFIFQDGIKPETNLCEWEKVNRLIANLDWCNSEIIVSEHNNGLATSIVTGINYTLKQYDAIIVLEDDCVPEQNFVNFMLQCFEKYKDHKRVYSVSGYSWPISIEKDSYDVYGCGRISSWGWGTWKDRWEQYNVDNNILKRLKQDKNKSCNLAMWASDCEQMLLGNIVGRNDSWAVYWALRVIELNGICINPYESLIQNIGLDGSGVHCGISDRFKVKVSEKVKSEFILPDQIEMRGNVKTAFANLYGNYTAVNEESLSKENVLVYGAGKFFAKYEKMLNEKYYIVAFVDRGKRGCFAGKKFVHLDEIVNYEYSHIIIMVANVQECIHIAKELIKNLKIDYKKIILGHSLFGGYHKGIDKISICEEGNLLLRFEDVSIKVRSMDEFNNVYETLGQHIYHYRINNGKRDVVLDIGMNVGDSVLYFLHKSSVDKVYGYEPFKQPFMMAKENLRDYYCNKERLEIFQYGISSENEKRKISFNGDMTCGQSTIESVRERAYEIYQSMGLVNQLNEETEEIQVYRASDIFEPIIQKYCDHNIILKMDCEGEEYCIIEELLQSGLLVKIKFLMMEWHYKGKNALLNYLEKAGFSWWSTDKSKDMGLIYAYRCDNI